MLILTFILILTSCLTPYGFPLYFFYNPLIFGLYCRFYFLFWFYTLVFLILSPWILTLRRRVTKMAGLCPWQFIRKNTSTNKHYIQNENVLFNPWNPDSKLFTGNNRKKQTCPPIYIRHPQGLPLLGTQSSLEIMRAAASCLNHGFKGFRGLTITSPVWVGRLLLNGAFIYRPFADALRIDEREGVKSIQFTNNPQVQTGDIRNNPWNPENPENPWFKNGDCCN